MSAHKLHIEEFDDINFHLVGIHTPLEDYRLAYFINKVVCLNLAKCNSEINIKNDFGETCFSHFIFEDENKDISWHLIQNQTEIISTKKLKGQGLFSETENQVLTKIFLLPEYNKVDFLLKIENENENENEKIQNILTKINTIERVSMAYLIDTEKTKSKNNLIF